MKISELRALPLKTASHNAQITKKTMLAKGDLPHLTNFSQAIFPPGQIAQAHRHQDMWEVFFVSQGQGEIFIDGELHELSPGVCVAVSAGETHEVINNGTENLVLIYFGIEE